MRVTDLLKSKVFDEGYAERDFIVFEDEHYTWAETYRRSLEMANTFLLLQEHREVPLHVGILMENYPEFIFAMFGCAFSRAVLVGLNTTQRGAALARDINHCDCQILLTETRFLDEVLAIKDDLRLVSDERILVNSLRDQDRTLPPGIDSLHDTLERFRAEHGEALSAEPDLEITPGDWVIIIFTSGSSGAPKAIPHSHGAAAAVIGLAGDRLGYSDRDVSYAVMPLFHSNSVGLALLPALGYGGTIALARRFSASGFLPDVRRHGATIFNYVGKPLAYILATPERPDDADNTLRAAIGNGATAAQQEAFRRRFGLDEVVEHFGSSEGGATVLRGPSDPPGTVGAMPPELKIMNERMEECPPAEVDASGAVLNPDEAIGEIINVGGVGMFEGYYKNPEATEAKSASGMFRTGDLAYYRVIEKDGEPRRFMYFVGRTDDWIRKDGENFLADPIEEILARYEDLFLCSVYGVPCAEGDEHVMAAIVLREGAEFDPEGFYRFLLDQPDMSRKWIPDYLRLAQVLPETDTVKILRRDLKRDAFNPDRVGDAMYWRERGEKAFKPFTRAEYERVRETFGRAGRPIDLS
jgi:fatty-acyl-CoA synthase